MKVLVIGFPLPHPDIDNYNIFTAPSYFDYDALVVDPESITACARRLVVDGETFEAFDGRPVINGPTTASAVSGADQVRRRLAEAQRLLEMGGTIVVVARPNALQTGLIGFEGCDRYSWLPASPGMAWSPPFLQAAEGRTIRIRAEDHPFAGLLREHRNFLTVRAVFDDRQPPLRQHGRVVAAGGAEVPVCVEFSVLGGRVLFIPAPGEEGGMWRSRYADDLLTAIGGMLASDEAKTEPYWARTVAIPGLEQVEAELEQVKSQASDIDARLDAVSAKQDALKAHRRLVTEEGKALQSAVADALVLLGFTVHRDDQQRIELETEGRRVLVETEGSTEQVVEWPYIRLQRRIEERLLRDGDAPRGMVIANGYRGRPPEEREAQVSTPLRVACENYRYALLTSETLFTLVQRALGGADDSALLGIRRRLLATSGYLNLERALGEEPETTESGPIF